MIDRQHVSRFLLMAILIAVVAVSLVACYWVFGPFYSEATLRAKLDQLSVAWTDRPQWRAPLKKPREGEFAVYHATLNPDWKQAGVDWRVLRDPRVADSLDGIDAYDCKDFGDDQLRYLANAENLRALGLEGTSVTDRGAEFIATHFPHLVMLDIEDSQITQAGLERILESHDLVMVDAAGLALNVQSLQQFATGHAPHTAIKVDGQGDIMNQPESVFERLPWP